MSASMAEVLEKHQLYVNTSHGDAWNPPEESASCSCGVDLGGWVASGADWEWPDGWGKEHGEHVAEVLAANGYGKLEDATRLIRDLTDPDDCTFDHHGGCQAHGYLSLEPGEMCPQLEAKVWARNHRRPE